MNAGNIIALVVGIVALIGLLSGISWKFHSKVDNKSKEAEVARGKIYSRFDDYKKHIETDLLINKVDEKMCDLKYKMVCDTMLEIKTDVKKLLNKNGIS